MKTMKAPSYKFFEIPQGGGEIKIQVNFAFKNWTEY